MGIVSRINARFARLAAGGSNWGPVFIIKHAVSWDEVCAGKRWEVDEVKFKRKFRLSRAQFDKVAELVSEHCAEHPLRELPQMCLRRHITHI